MWSRSRCGPGRWCAGDDCGRNPGGDRTAPLPIRPPGSHPDSLRWRGWTSSRWSGPGRPASWACPCRELDSVRSRLSVCSPRRCPDSRRPSRLGTVRRKIKELCWNIKLYVANYIYINLTESIICCFVLFGNNCWGKSKKVIRRSCPAASKLLSLKNCKWNIVFNCCLPYLWMCICDLYCCYQLSPSSSSHQTSFIHHVLYYAHAEHCKPSPVKCAICALNIINIYMTLHMYFLQIRINQMFRDLQFWFE